MDLATFAVQLLNGVQYGLVLFLVASGLTLVFGILGVINLAHGAFYMLGAYVGVLAHAEDRQLLARARRRRRDRVRRRPCAREACSSSGSTAAITSRRCCSSYGLILVLDEVRQILFGKDVHSVAAPEFLRGSFKLTEMLSYQNYRLAICLFCLAVAAAIFFVIAKTRVGMIVRAAAENRDMTRALGIRFDRGQPAGVRRPASRSPRSAASWSRRSRPCSRAWATRC